MVAEPGPRHIGVKIFHRLIDPLVAILIVAAVVSGAVGDLASCAIILLVIAFSIALEVTQERNAEKAVDLLKRSVAVHAAVRRDGRVVEMPVEELVPGDVVELTAGDLVPADGIALEANGAQTNEALLTGEAFPVDKRPGLCTATTPAEAFNAFFGGTALVRGTAVMLVTATGNRTRFGGIAAALEFGPTARDARAQPACVQRAHSAAHRLHGPVCAAGTSGLLATGSRIFPVRAGAGGRDDAGAPADDHDSHALSRRRAHGRAQGGGEAARRNP